VAFDTFGGDEPPISPFDFKNEFGTDLMSQCAGFRLAPNRHRACQNQRDAHPNGSRTPISLVRGHGHKTEKRAIRHGAGRLFHPLGDVFVERARHQVNDTFAIRRDERSTRVQSIRGAGRWPLVILPLWPSRQPPMANHPKNRLHGHDRCRPLLPR